MGVIVVRKAGQKVPEAFLALAIKENDSYLGIATVMPGEGESAGELFLVEGKTKETLSVTDITATFDSMPDTEIVAYLGGKDISPESMQPFSLLVKDDDVILSAFLEGDFPGYAEPKSAHSPEYFVVEKTLRQKFVDLFDMVDQDVDKLLSALDKPSIANDLMMFATKRGTITLILSNGKIKTFAKKEDTQPISADWGWASNSFGYGAAKAAGPKSLLQTMKDKLPGAMKAQAVEPSDNKDKPVIVLPKDIPSTDGNMILVSPPKEYDAWSKQQKSSWWSMLGTQKPSGFKTMTHSQIKVPMAKDKLSKAFRDKYMPGFEALASKLPPGQYEVTEGIASAGEKNEMITKFIPAVRQFIAKNGSPIPDDPKKIPEYEAKLPSFADQLGLANIYEAAAWPRKFYGQLIKEQPKLTETLLCNLAVIAKKYEAVMNQGKVAEEEEDDEVEQTPGVGPTAPETKPEVKPETGKPTFKGFGKAANG